MRQNFNIFFAPQLKSLFAKKTSKSGEGFDKSGSNHKSQICYHSLGFEAVPVPDYMRAKQPAPAAPQARGPAPAAPQARGLAPAAPQVSVKDQLKQSAADKNMEVILVKRKILLGFFY